MTTLTRYVWGDLDCCTASDYHETQDKLHLISNQQIQLHSSAVGCLGICSLCCSSAGFYVKGLPPSPRLFPDCCQLVCFSLETGRQSEADASDRDRGETWACTHHEKNLKPNACRRRLYRPMPVTFAFTDERSSDTNRTTTAGLTLPWIQIFCPFPFFDEMSSGN